MPKNEKSFEAFAETLSENEQLGKWVESLRVGAADDDNPEYMSVEMARILMRFPYLRELWATGLIICARHFDFVPSERRRHRPPLLN